MSVQWRRVSSAVLAAILFAVPAFASSADPFQKAGQGRLSHEMNVRALAAEGDARIPGMRALVRGGANRAAMVTAILEMEKGADRAGIAAQVGTAGGRVVLTIDHLMKVQVPAASLRRVSEIAGVERVRAPFKPSLKKRDDVVSEGVQTTHAREFSSRTGATGAGVTVAVLDGGFARAVDLLGSELPEDTAGTQFVLDRIDEYEGVHGTACAEIVHDMAKDARILLAGFEDDATWAQAVDEVVGAGVRIVSHSIGFDNLFPADGNNYYTQKVDQAAAAGVFFVTAAGNEGGKYYSGSWRDANRNEYLEFGAGGTELLPIEATPGGTQVVLRWDDNFGQSNHDYDIFIVTGGFVSDSRLTSDNPNILAASVDLQNGGGNPREIVDFDNESGEQLYAVVRHDPASPVSMSQRFWIWASDGVAGGYAVATGSLTLPGDARGAFTVGAVSFASGIVEGFSSRGPTHDGRVKPDIAGPDGVTTASYDGEPFFGTSAATPHVAGAAALLLSRNPSLSVSGLRQALEAATAGGGRTRNNDVGAGVLDLNLAR